jgi:hypothetical protein
MNKGILKSDIENIDNDEIYFFKYHWSFGTVYGNIFKLVISEIDPADYELIYWEEK